MTILDLLLGRPLASDEARGEQIGSLVGVPVFGLDALSSAAYGPEAALTLLIPLSLAGIAYIVPISVSIIALLTIAYFSYRQTIQAYPGGGGSYTVARQNLGASAGLLAAAALMIDYVLVVAVGISAGVGALVSAVPKLQPWTLLLCLVILALITLVNLRGVRETGLLFYGADVSLRGVPRRRHRFGRGQGRRRERSSDPCRATSEASVGCRGSHCLAVAPSVRERLYGLDRRGGSK